MIPEQFDSEPEFSVMLSSSDLQKVTEIDHYYQNLLSLLNLSERLDAEEKIGQCAFLTREWEREIIPLLSLTSIKIYGAR